MKTLPSVCALDCPDTCALRITVDQGKAIALQGDKNHPITRGFACVKTARYPERQHHPDRLTKPLLRAGPKGSGVFQPITWDEALARIADRLQHDLKTHGGDSIMPYSYAGTMGLVERDHPLAFFRALGATELDWTICAATGGAGWELAYGPNKLSVAPEDAAKSGAIVLWGINVARSNSHFIPWMNAAQKRGARIWHIDPYCNETSRLADGYMQIRVGTDTALALAIGREILQRGRQDHEYLAAHCSGLEAYLESVEPWTIARAAEFCGVESAQIEQLIEDICSVPNPLFRVGYGMTRNEGGGNAMLAVSLLPALLGAWKHQGGGALLSTSGAFGLNTKRPSGVHLLQPNVRHVNQNQLASALLELQPPIRSLIVFNSNPAAVAPDSSRVRQGLRRDDLFTVVLEHFQTDTADYADILCLRPRFSNIQISIPLTATIICNGPNRWWKRSGKQNRILGSSVNYPNVLGLKMRRFIGLQKNSLKSCYDQTILIFKASLGSD